MKVFLMLMLAAAATANFSARVDRLMVPVIGSIDLYVWFGRLTGGLPKPMGDLQVGDYKLKGSKISLQSLTPELPSRAFAEDKTLRVNTGLTVEQLTISADRVESAELTADNVQLVANKSTLMIDWSIEFGEDGSCNEHYNKVDLVSLRDVTVVISQDPPRPVRPAVVESMRQLVNSYLQSGNLIKTSGLCDIPLPLPGKLD